MKEIPLSATRQETAAEPIETIYFGGGTPSLCTVEELQGILESIAAVYKVLPGAEITLEANPDDITAEKLKGWQRAGINRLSIGVQSFFEEDLQWMNRAHTAIEAVERLQLARQHFDNITIDLIYGTPGLTDEKWKANVEKAISLDIPHLSCYALTVEPRTPLDKMIRERRRTDVDAEQQSRQFLLLMQWLEKAGYEHYEISNFARPGWRSRHNSAYWQGKHYIGIGPSAHSFDGVSRWWNIANNQAYTRSIETGIIPFEKEELTPVQQVNEYIMISLRTMEGLDLMKVSPSWKDILQQKSKRYMQQQLMQLNGQRLVLTRKGKLLADGIAADLFIEEAGA